MRRSEAQRVAVVASLGLLDTPREERFDRVSRTAATLFDVPVALVTLLDAERLFVKSSVGDVPSEVERSAAVCETTVGQDAPLVVPDLSEDPRFAALPVVADDGLRFYAGVPLHVHGTPVGTLCLFGEQPRSFADADVARLQDLGVWAESELDRTELARALAKEHETSTRLGAVLDASPDAVLVLGPDGLVQEANAAAEEVFGRPREEVLHAHVATLLATTDGGPLGDLLQQDGLVPAGLRARRRGTTAAVEVRSRRLDLPGLSRVLDVRDVSGEAEATAALDALRQRYELLLEAAETGVIGTDADGGITVVNPVAARLLGLAAVPSGRDLHDLAHGDLHRREDCPLLRALAERVPQRVPVDQVVRTDGQRLDVEWTAAPTIAAGVVTGAVVTLSDTTARRAVDRMKDEFISVVSHELRTPLTSIRGSLGLLGSGRFGALPDAATRLVQIAVGNTDRLVRLVNDILDLERIESGKVDLSLVLQPLQPLLEQTRDAVVGEGGGVQVVLDAGGLDAATDADLLVQALTNLLANAVKFSPPGSVVQVTARGVGGEVHVAVRDSGRGIPADRLARVFERFEQVDASDARDKGGTGLGLAITRSIATALGGRVLVASEVGVGSTFTLALPRGLDGDEQSGRWVVLVEDDVDLSEVLAAGLAGQGFDVAVARTEEEAVALVRRLRPVVLLLDVELARGSGYGVAAQLRGDPALARTRVVVATVHDLDEARRQRLRLGETRYVCKGRGDEDVVQVVLALAKEAVA